jgi:hypothetical protein
MPAPTRRISDAAIDQLADGLEKFTKAATKKAYTNYPLSVDPPRKIGVMRAEGFPSEGLTTATSLGLSHESWTDQNFPDRMELMQVWDSPSPEYERLLVAVCDGIVTSHNLPKPGVVFVDPAKAAGLPDLEARMPYATVLFPYLWDLEKVDVDGARVWLLQVVPLFEKEAKSIREKGFKNFEEILSFDGVSFEHLNRHCHIM